ncbi:hypothetical protein UY3_09203 [Chelonia mydas]|uniref:Uncharacterized protein n=1 Tax=Chelonia mydas TaxID=8469 RepID=M7B6R8_CHEMY|nr:hypothetical protein UY3_09203 [Chelonia mydas]
MLAVVWRLQDSRVAGEAVSGCPVLQTYCTVCCQDTTAERATCLPWYGKTRADEQICRGSSPARPPGEQESRVPAEAVDDNGHIEDLDAQFCRPTAPSAARTQQLSGLHACRGMARQEQTSRFAEEAALRDHQESRRAECQQKRWMTTVT